MTRERVDDAVEPFVGDALALVAPPLEDHSLPAAREIIQEAADQGGLPHAGNAADVNGHGPALPRRRERFVQEGEVARPADERRLSWDGAVPGLRARLGADAREDLFGAGACGRCLPEQL